MTHTPSPRIYYTNETTEALLRKLDELPFSEEQLASFHPAELETIRQSQSRLLTHPAAGIRRLATEGSQSRLGGRIVRGSSPVNFTLADGEKVSAAIIGDLVEYPDGSIAHIVTGAGQSYSNLALVGSLLDNGDEIVNTPQGCAVLVLRKGHTWPGDFLPGSEAQR
ncbi:hypothetical protein M2D07_012765 [Pseudomonas sp. BGr12]|uniref:hypothetical protein n=1 Tax=unclassified Pseudomonas TaxID=196821 RepID=UPI00178672F6|nr:MULTISPECIES: hypothetical protein [unclassified Pseudomonas]MBD9500065.1 hypothetical protein [Pseudomonas sp. PDM17]MDL2427884.1 hypothetical protein [Pseudomonas sp. BJa5]